MKRTDDKTNGSAGSRHPEARSPLRLVRAAGEREGALGRSASSPGRGRAGGGAERSERPVVGGPVEERRRSADDADAARVGRVRDSRASNKADDHASNTAGTREWEVRAETAAAASLAAHDARWVTAARASQAIEGGRAAVLRPEVRARLVSSAERMGLRPFDANLVLAIVQDAARQGRTIQDADTIDRLALVRGRTPSTQRRGGFALLCVGLSAMWAVLLIWWLRG
ncbi:MAG: hypothetical protein Q9O74_06575 [Planctomycetota bacterium]|nr:hypothetical protein [Planctomycetota bacterium]